MADNMELDERVKPLYGRLKLVGTALVAVAASAVVIAGSLSVVAAGITAVLALAVVNFVVPVGARYIALKKQQALTYLAEEFSEETIREDEQNEEARLQEQQRLYQAQCAEFGNVIDALHASLKNAKDDEHHVVQDQIDMLNNVLKETEDSIKIKIEDLKELKRVNGIYISLCRASKVLKRGQDLQRNSEEIARLETARKAIKTRMREALVGQKVQAMNTTLNDRLSSDALIRLDIPNKPIR